MAQQLNNKSSLCSRGKSLESGNEEQECSYVVSRKGTLLLSFSKPKSGLDRYLRVGLALESRSTLCRIFYLGYKEGGVI